MNNISKIINSLIKWINFITCPFCLILFIASFRTCYVFYLTIIFFICQQKLYDSIWQIMTELIIPAKSASSAAANTKRIFFTLTQAV